MMNASASFADPPHTAAAVPTALPASIAMDTAAINASGVALPLPEADAPTVLRECTRSRRTPLLFSSVEHVWLHANRRASHRSHNRVFPITVYIA